MHNDIVTSAYNLSVNEQRLILCALAKMPKCVPVEKNTAFYVTRDDFIAMGASSDQVAREIRAATKELMRRTIAVPTNSGVFEFQWLKQVLRYDKLAEEKLKERYPDQKDYNQYMSGLIKYNFFDSIGIGKDDDNIITRIVFSDEILPLISDLKEYFVQIFLEDMAHFGSIYSFRIYKLLMRYKSTGFVRISLQDLRFMLVLNDKYPKTADLKRWVIETAVNEINDKSPYQVTYEMLKAGRKHTGVEIKFKPKKSASKETTKRNPTTFDHPPINTEKTPSWQRKGLSDAQIKKLAIYKYQFVEANTHLLRDKNISYYDAFEDFKGQLKDPEHVGKFHMLAEFLALKKGDESPEVAKKPAQSKKKASKATAEVSKNKGLTVEQIDFFANHPQFLIDHPVKSYEVGSKDHISYLKFRMDSAPGEFYTTDFDKYLK